MRDIYVIDTETTGLTGAPDDHVVDIGIALLETDTGRVMPLYQSLVGYDVDEWDPAHRNAWIFSHSDLTLDDVAAAPPQADVRYRVATLLAGARVTSYNTPFDLDKFLFQPPWRLSEVVTAAPDIMAACAPVVADRSHPGGKYPRLMHSYTALCEDDPADLRGAQQHRALSDAMAAAYVLRQLVIDEKYKVTL